MMSAAEYLEAKAVVGPPKILYAASRAMEEYHKYLESGKLKKRVLPDDTFEVAVDLVCEWLDILREAIHNNTEAKKMLCHILDHARYTQTSIAAAMGYIDHTGVIYSLKKAKDLDQNILNRLYILFIEITT